MTTTFNQRAVSITLNGMPIAAKLAQVVSQIVVRQELAAPSLAEIDFAAPEDAEVAQLSIGAPLSLRVGKDGENLFDGEITCISFLYSAGHVMVVRVRAYDKLQRLRKSFRPRLLENLTAATLGAGLASELGLTSTCYGQPPSRCALIQHEQSDFDLLADLAADAGLYPFLDGQQLVLTGLDGFGEAVDLRLGADLYEFSASISNDWNARGTTVRGWNTVTSASFSDTVTTSRQDSYEMRDVSPNEGAEGYRLLFNRTPENSAEASALAAADFDRTAARSTEVHGASYGNAKLAPGRPVVISGVAEKVAGRYVLSSAVHRITVRDGYVTQFSTEPPTRRPRPRAPLATLGVVADTTDPERQGRCRVTLPALGESATLWMQVMIAGAGEDKGLAAFPEAGDQVLVLCPDGDAAHGIVLGSLYGEARLPRGFRDERPRPFILRTSNGQRLELSSTTNTVRLATAHGSLLELMPGQARLATATDLIIEAPGKTITFRANFVNFERT